MASATSRIDRAVSRGDVFRKGFDPERLPLYLGSGDGGALFDAYGLIGEAVKDDEFGAFKHRDYYMRGRYGIDYWLPLYTLTLAQRPAAAPEEYRQRLRLFAGTLETEMVLAGEKLSSEVFFHPGKRDVLALILRGAWKLKLAPVRRPSGGYKEVFEVKPEVTADGFVIRTNRSEVAVTFKIVRTAGECRVDRDGADTFVTMERGGECLLLVGSAAASRAAALLAELDGAGSAEAWRASAAEAWAKRWGDAYLDLADDRRQRDWARSLYYVLCSFSPDGVPSAPMGWIGAKWRFHFPQDISYIHPALLRLGHYDIAKRIVEFYRERVDDVRAITRRLYGGSGTMWPWEFPIGGGTELLANEVPNVYQFEIHNAAYPARMAYETSLHLRDADWTRDVALPVVKGSAEFYASHLEREANGRYSLNVTPSMSQDEFGTPNGRNYLCGLYSARYTFKTAVALGLKEYEKYLASGLSFDRLIDREHGIYRTAEVLCAANYGSEKHPVQLNPLTFLPAAPDEYELNAYRQRFDICGAAKERVYNGWTLAAFWLASSHLGDAAALEHELALGDDPDYRDAEMLQFYETSKRTNRPYYVTTHGLYLQAVQDAFVCDLFGGTVLENAVPKSWRGSRYVNLRIRDGNACSGTV